MKILELLLCEWIYIHFNKNGYLKILVIWPESFHNLTFFQIWESMDVLNQTWQYNLNFSDQVRWKQLIRNKMNCEQL